jgi:hypothetical protein
MNPLTTVNQKNNKLTTVHPVRTTRVPSTAPAVPTTQVNLKKKYFKVTILLIYSHNFAIIQSKYYNFTVTTLPLYTIFPLSRFNTNILQSQLRYYTVNFTI